METSRRKREGFLRFGTRVEDYILLATAMSDALYEGLPDRKDCVICGGPLTKNIHYPCCSKGCRKEYKDWLNERRLG
ncbi:MAG TPA: hypothetical protein ACFYD3_07410 [Candidatus Hypogeohydataceae bacterium YC41]